MGRREGKRGLVREERIVRSRRKGVLAWRHQGVSGGAVVRGARGRERRGGGSEGEEGY